MQQLEIKKLSSGGLIVGYACPSQCGHCLYNSGPGWEKRFITPKEAADCARTALRMGCRSLHVGGGEPFLRPAALVDALTAARAEGVGIDYVETNSSWYQDPGQAVELLLRVRDAGVATLLVSISPFHSEKIPFAKVKGVLGACREADVRVFPWVMDFYDDLDAFDDTATHSLGEYEARTPGYLASIPRRYWVHLGGRAARTFAGVLPMRPADHWARSGGCAELADTSHFHLDLYGNYVPGLCAGLAIDQRDLGRPLDAERYPLVTLLWNKGVAGLLELAQDQGFVANPDGYVSKCGLCQDARAYLFDLGAPWRELPELRPQGFYLNR